MEGIKGTICFPNPLGTDPLLSHLKDPFPKLLSSPAYPTILPMSLAVSSLSLCVRPVHRPLFLFLSDGFLDAIDGSNGRTLLDSECRSICQPIEYPLGPYRRAVAASFFFFSFGCFLCCAFGHTIGFLGCAIAVISSPRLSHRLSVGCTYLVAVCRCRSIAGTIRSSDISTL